jgi:GTP-binding protein HflX
VIDASHPHANDQIEAVDRVIGALSRRSRAEILVFNKIDRVEDRIAMQLLRHGRTEEVVYVSATSGEGIELLEAAVARRLDARSAVFDIFVPLANGRLNARVHRLGRPMEDDISLETEERRLRLRLTDAELGSLRRAGEGSLRIVRVDPISAGESITRVFDASIPPQALDAAVLDGDSDGRIAGEA